MATILLFHAILGLRGGEEAFARALRADGHRVILPDLYDGARAETYDAAFALKDRIGDATLHARATAALAAAPDDAVLAGISFGAFMLGRLWGDRPAMPGAILLSGIAPWMTPRRAGLPVLCDIARPDPFDDESFFADWVAEAGPVALDLCRHDGAGHLFLDPTLPDHDPVAAGRAITRARDFLRRIDAARPA